MEYFVIIISAIFVNNILLAKYLGNCPFLGVSSKIESAVGMGLAATFVMTLAATVTWLIYHNILVRFNVPFLEYVSFIWSLTIPSYSASVIISSPVLKCLIKFRFSADADSST